MSKSLCVECLYIILMIEDKRAKIEPNAKSFG